MAWIDESTNIMFLVGSTWQDSEEVLEEVTLWMNKFAKLN